MAEETQKWEYRVQTVGAFWSGVKAYELEQLLNEWGEEGWEVVSTHILENANKINVIAKRTLSSTTRRFRSMPLQSSDNPFRRTTQNLFRTFVLISNKKIGLSFSQTILFFTSSASFQTRRRCTSHPHHPQILLHPPQQGTQPHNSFARP